MPTFFKIDPMRYTPFDKGFMHSEYQYLEANGLTEVMDHRQADFLVASSKRKLQKWSLFNPNHQINSKFYGMMRPLTKMPGGKKLKQ